MTLYKTIFKGRFEFGSPKSFEKVLKMYEHRVENYYRNDILLNQEEIFDHENAALNVPRFICQSTQKSWKNTISLLEYLSEFAVAGSLVAWMTDSGKVLHYKIIEPQSDRTAVQSFIKGRKLANEAGKEGEAMAALTKAIEKYERHAMAYERRGHVNFHLKNFKDAHYDYSKSIDLAPANPEPYYGRANIYILNKNLMKAIEDLEMTIKTSIPLEPIYWKARLKKAECLINSNMSSEAALDLKLFTKRKFLEDNPNYVWRKYALLKYGRILVEEKDYQTALDILDQALNEKPGKGKVNDADILYYRGIARKESGKPGFVKDWKESARMGSTKSSKLLEANTKS